MKSLFSWQYTQYTSVHVINTSNHLYNINAQLISDHGEMSERNGMGVRDKWDVDDIGRCVGQLKAD